MQGGYEERYGSFDTAKMRLLSDNTLRKLATSWGPLQIMGYHCVPMGISFEELQGIHAMFHAIVWAEKSYGAYLRDRDFKNALHIHNTGRPFPASGKSATYDPSYIEKGLKYIELFEQESTNYEKANAVGPSPDAHSLRPLPKPPSGYSSD